MKKNMDELLKRENEDGLFDNDLLIVFPSTVPNSGIVFDENGDGVKTKIYKLYTKYVKKNGEFEINILDSTRKKIHNLMKDYDAWMQNNYFDEIGLLHFYDVCIREMQLLLIASFKRFKETEYSSFNIMIE